MKIAFVKSITSGKNIACTVIKTSWIRNFFNLPNVKIRYINEGLTKTIVVESWRYKEEVHNA